MSKERVMWFPNVSLKKWLKITGLEVSEYNCEKCGGSFETNIPVVIPDYYGICSPTHQPCGEGWSKIAVTPRSQAEKDSWDEIFAGLSL